ncbi:hypothetical protein [Flavobacterium sp. ov086]|uniref:hypothetical protein n=1 Tax=Flavobacterium sp. ov086 TaxID=1761785 RepID=UPI000B6DFDE6|nr:hypothetical protein [Flavobacterium sp. ov086]SNR29610.1 hypothetical protein SAMN04487979_10245 [Flavobacterium sp. ov086]
MKIKIKEIFFLSMIFVFCDCYIYSQEIKLVGRWINSEEFASINSIEFSEDNLAVMFQNANASPTFSFITDFNKQPVWIDMTVVKNGHEVKILGLLDFINSDKIKMELFYGNLKEHPSSFSLISNSQSQLYIFNRVK